MTGRPSFRRRAVSEEMTKLEAGSPPGPTDRYIRMPTRLTTATRPAAGGAAVSAHTTAYRSPADTLACTRCRARCNLCCHRRSDGGDRGGENPRGHSCHNKQPPDAIHHATECVTVPE